MNLFKFLKLKLGRPAVTQNKYAFVLCPPYCGSTLLTQILSSSNNVSINNSIGTSEGQTLPEVRDHLFVENRWDEDLEIDWPFVKKVWERYWDLKKPVLLEKSPPNIIRVRQILQHFEPAYFFAMWRNPYAHCESQIRRNGNNPREAAGFAIRCLDIQRRNIEHFDNLLPISYEQLTNQPALFVQRANRFLPELGNLRIQGRFEIHNISGQKKDISDLNQEKIELLNSQERREMNLVFSQHRDIFDYFGYRLLE